MNYVSNLSTTITAYKYRGELRLQPAYYEYSVNFVFNLSTTIIKKYIEVNYVFHLRTTITEVNYVFHQNEEYFDYFQYIHI